MVLTNNESNKNGIQLLRWIVYLFVFSYMLFPDYFAIEISNSFPLLSASRISIILLLFVLLIYKRGKISTINDKKISFFFILIIAIQFYHFSDAYNDSIKNIFSFILEQLLLIILIVNFLDEKNKCKKALICMVLCAGIIGGLGLVEFVFKTNVFYLLKTTNRDMLQSSYIRLGSMRAEGPFGHAVYYATYLSCMLPFSINLYNIEKKTIYLITTITITIGIVCSMSRAQVIVAFAYLIILFFLSKPTIKIRYIKIFIIVLPALFIVILLFPQVLNTLDSIFKSIVNIFGSYYEIENFGANSDGVSSRTDELSAVIWSFQCNRQLFGFGEGCLSRDEIRMYYGYRHGWYTSHTIDIGYLGHFIKYGIIGLISYLGLYKHFISTISAKDIFLKPFFHFIIIYLINLFSVCSVSSIDKMFFLLFGIAIAYKKTQ